MPQNIKIPPLRELTLARMTELLSEVTKISSDLIDYFHDAPVVICEDLLHQLLSEHELESEFKLRVLHLLLRPQITALSTGMFHPSDYFRVLNLISAQGKSLKSLNLTGVWAKDEHCKILERTLSCLPNLQELYMPHMANDKILQVLAKHNKVLKILDISGETKITHNGILSFLTELSTQDFESQLEILNIGFPGDENISAADIALLLVNLRKLQSLGCYSYVGKALLCLKSSQKNANKTTLKYLHDTNTDLCTINTIIELCPELESMYLDMPEQGVISELQHLAQLNKLKLCKFHCKELEELLENKHSFTKLDLLIGTGSLDISVLAANCTQISQFSCWKIEFLRHSELTDIPCMKVIRISTTPISSLCVKYLLTSCPALQEIYIDEPIDITDTDMQEILEKQCLKNLEVLWFGDARNLTMVTILSLLEMCMVLKNLGDIIGWGLSLEEIDELHQLVFANNLDLTLLQSE